MRILIVEDNEDMVAILQGNTAITVAVDAVAALQALESQTFDRVYCDVHGIEKDGFDARSVIERCVVLGVAVLTTSSDNASNEKFERLFGTGRIEKIDVLSTYGRAD